MTKKNFTKMVLLMLGDISLIMGIILMCSQTGFMFNIGIAALVLGLLLIIIGSIYGKPKKVKTGEKKKSRAPQVLGVIAVTAALHITGTILMINVNWIIGLAVILLGLLNISFVVPASKGFKDDNDEK